MKVTYDLGDKTIISATVAFLTYIESSNTFRSVTGIKIVTTIAVDGTVTRQGSTLPLDNNGRPVLPEVMSYNIEMLEKSWRPNSV